MAQGGYVPTGSVEPVEMLAGVTRHTLGTTDNLMLAEFSLDEGAIVPLHSHPHEQVASVIEGRLELSIDGESRSLGPGSVAVIPPNAQHGGRAITACRVVDVWHPRRDDLR